MFCRHTIEKNDIVQLSAITQKIDNQYKEGLARMQSKVHIFPINA